MGLGYFDCGNAQISAAVDDYFLHLWSMKATNVVSSSIVSAAGLPAPSTGFRAVRASTQRRSVDRGTLKRREISVMLGGVIGVRARRRHV